MNYSVMISVIMPVYNAEKFLEKAIKSILNQSFTDFELILIDDGSTDKSGKICDRYKELDSRVRVIHQLNGGICHARNVGIQFANGKYISFSDNDDEMLPECLKKTIDFAEKEQLNVVRFIRRHDLIWGSHIKSEQPKVFKKEVIQNVFSWNDFLKIINSCGYGVWAGIYNRDFINKNEIRFDEEIRYGYEDHVFTVSCVIKGNHVGILPECLYIWRQRKENSTSCKMSKEVLQNRLTGILKWIDTEGKMVNEISISETDRNLRKHEYFVYILNEILQYYRNSREKKIIVNEYKNKIGYKKMNFEIFCRVGYRQRIKYMCMDLNMINSYVLLQYLSLYT